MKLKTQFLATFTPIVLGFGVSTIVIALSSAIIPQSATAQSADRVKPLEDLNNRQNEQDTLTGTGGLSVFDLIHRSQLGVDSQGFSDTVGQNVDKATQEFLLQRQPQLNPQQQVLPTNPPPTSQTTN